MQFFAQMLELYGSGLYLLSSIPNWLLIIFGTGVGVFFGSLPGLTSTMSLVVFTPMTFGLSPGTSILFLMSIYAGSVFGGAISAVTLNIPGTPSAICTGLDGYPLAQKGEAGKAISVATISSVIGSLFGLVILMIFAPFLAEGVKHFGSWEYAAVAMLGLSIVSYISEGPMVNGLIGACIGLLISAVGYEKVTAYPRFSFGNAELTAGFNDIVIMIGVFGFAEILNYMSQNVKVEVVQKLKIDFIDSFKMVFRYMATVLRSSAIGTFIGAIPAAGGGIASLAAYGITKQIAKDPEQFGKGAYEGIVAAESANNASVGGAVIPMITLGIPGDPMTAVLIGALMLHGLTPGPLLFKENPEVVSSIFLGLGLATFFMLAWGLLGAKIFARALSTPAHLLYPIIIVLCIVGTYVLRFSIFDVAVAVIFGVLAFFLKKIQISSLPIILGLILGPMVEENLRRALLLGDGSIVPFFTRPLSLIFIVITVVLFVGGLLQSRKLNKLLLSSTAPEKQAI